jgi:hypothetical protein
VPTAGGPVHNGFKGRKDPRSALIAGADMVIFCLRRRLPVITCKGEKIHKYLLSAVRGTI